MTALVQTRVVVYQYRCPDCGSIIAQVLDKPIPAQRVEEITAEHERDHARGVVR